MAKTNDRVVELARTWLGTPYYHQASIKGVGCDCVGLVRGVYRELYGYEPPVELNYSWDWGDANGNEDMVAAASQYLEPVPLDRLVPGNVILVRWRKGRVAKHSMILSGPMMAIHSYNGSLVTEVHLSDWWLDRVIYGFSFPTAGE